MTQYGSESIQHLEGREHVRLRPEMYIADREAAGVHQLLWEVVDNGVDEFLAGHCDKITVRLDTTANTITVTDNGRGIPWEVNEKQGLSALHMAVGLLNTGGKFGKAVYAESAGLHGVGVKATNFLSSAFEATTFTKGAAYTVRFKKGVVVTTQPKHTSGAAIPGSVFKVQNPEVKVSKGTRIKFTPDTEIFGDVKFDVAVIQAAFKNAMYVCPGLRFVLTVANGEASETFEFYSANGLLGLLDEWTVGLSRHHEPVHIKTPDVEIAFCWTSGEGERFTSYVNTKRVPEGGTHETGFRRACTTVLTKAIESEVDSSDLREGLIAAIHFKSKTPRFQGQAKTKLLNPEADGIVSRATQPAIEALFNENESLKKLIVDRAVELSKARARFKSVRGTLTKLEVASRSSMVLPGKLLSSPGAKPQDRELYLVEGDSALGSCRYARNPTYQEALPLRGKVRNVERVGDDTALKNQEIQNIIISIGCGVDQVRTGDGCNPDNARVGKVYLLADADPDGHHINSLLTAFFLIYMAPMVEQGRVFVVQSPLYIGKRGDKRVFGDSLDEIQQAFSGQSHTIKRLKGHGEANVDEIKAYAFDPDTRRTTMITATGKDHARRLMSADVDSRKILLGMEGGQIGQAPRRFDLPKLPKRMR